jgi:hypothetical protein
MTGGALSGAPGDEPDETDDLLEVGSSRAQWLTRLLNPPRRQHSRLRSALGLALALALGLTVGLATHRKADHPAATQPVQHDVARISMPAVRAFATHRGPLVSYVRQSSPAHACALVAVGHSPARTISTAIGNAFPGYKFKDAATTLDQFTGLCSIEVRATRPGGVVVVQIASPTAQSARTAYARLETGVETDGAVTTKYALALNQSGWTLLVGAIGSSAHLPGAEALMRFVQEPSLTW